jgi:transposase
MILLRSQVYPKRVPLDSNWAWVHRELRRPNVTLALLWEEYRASAPDGFGYSWCGPCHRNGDRAEGVGSLS